MKRKAKELGDKSKTMETKKEDVQNEAADAATSGLDKTAKGKRKKALKRMRRGQVTRNDIEILRRTSKGIDGVDVDFETMYGEDARIELTLVKSYLKDRRHVTASAVRNFLQWTITERKGTNPKWIFIKNKPLVRLVLLVLAEEGFKGDCESMPELSAGRRVLRCDVRLSRHNREIRDVVDALATEPKVEDAKTASNSDTKTGGPRPVSFTSNARLNEDQHAALLGWTHSREELDANEYYSAENRPEGFKISPARHRVDDAAANEADDDAFEPAVAVDCEMCRTTVGLELTRITAVAWNGDVLLDEFVRPSHPIVDYLTKYSGITEDMMRDVKTTLDEVRDRLFRFVKADTVLVGHSLDSDLKALRICHSRILDSSILYPHPRGSPYKHKLAYITKGFLRREIQKTDRNGHDSKEDALAALDLVKLKLSRGRLFGYPDRLRRQSLLIDFPSENVPRMYAVGSSREHLAVIAKGVDGRRLVQQLCTSDETTLEYTHKILREVLAESSSATTTTFVCTSLSAPVADADTTLAGLASQLPVNGIMVVVGRKHSTEVARATMDRRKASRREMKWTAEEERSFRDAMTQTQQARCFVTFNNRTTPPPSKS